MARELVTNTINTMASLFFMFDPLLPQLATQCANVPRKWLAYSHMPDIILGTVYLRTLNF